MKNSSFQSIKNEKDFLTIFKKGKTLSNEFFLVKFLRNKSQVVEYGISASKKHFKKAVLRNKIKRQLRNIIWDLKEVKKIKILIIVKSNYETTNFKRNKLLLTNLYNKIKI